MDYQHSQLIKKQMNNQKKKELGRIRICAPKKSAFIRNGLNNAKTGKLKAAFMQKFLWPNGSTITIHFMNNAIIQRKNVDEILRESPSNLKLDPLQYEIDGIENKHDAIKLIIEKRFAQFCNLNFVFVNNMDADIRINFDSDNGCWSYVGTDCKNPKYKGQPTLNLAWFDVATTMHEFGHALGMIHEHQNPKSNPIKWDKDAVNEWANQTQGWSEEEVKTNIIDMPKYQINGSEFDPTSIMLYFFPGSLTTNNKGTSENLRLSKYDVTYLNKMYPGSKKTPSEFYKETYGEKIEPSILKSAQDTNKIPLSLIIVGVIIVLITILIFVI